MQVQGVYNQTPDGTPIPSVIQPSSSLGRQYLVNGPTAVPPFGTTFNSGSGGSVLSGSGGGNFISNSGIGMHQGFGDVIFAYDGCLYDGEAGGDAAAGGGMVFWSDAGWGPRPGCWWAYAAYPRCIDMIGDTGTYDYFQNIVYDPNVCTQGGSGYPASGSHLGYPTSGSGPCACPSGSGSGFIPAPFGYLALGKLHEITRVFAVLTQDLAPCGVAYATVVLEPNSAGVWLGSGSYPRGSGVTPPGGCPQVLTEYAITVNDPFGVQNLCPYGSGSCGGGSG
jgi:hypothetical protein